jgi:gliding motility-associated-like protein
MDSAFCGMPDGSATLNVNGGTPPYLYNWNSSPAQNSQNLANVPTGNYTVIVTDNKNCTASVSVEVDQKPGPSASATSTNEICDKSDGTATAVASGGMGVYTYLWSNGETTPTDTGLAQGSYIVTVSDGGCTTSQTAYVNETLGPVAAFTENPQILTILDGPVDFFNSSTGNVVNWQWTFGDNTAGNGADVFHQYKNIGTYIVTLIVTDNNGCMDTITDSVLVKDVFTFYIPNAFTPNGGMLNNYFFPQGMNVDPNNFEMSIFDRWGNLMFHTTEWFNNQSVGWNGTLNNSGSFSEAVMDVYVYRIILKEVDGTQHEYIGKVTVAP